MNAERNSRSYRKNDFFTTARIYHREFYLFSKQKAYNKDKRYSVDCRACRTASFCIFCFFLIKRIYRLKYERQSTVIHFAALVIIGYTFTKLIYRIIICLGVLFVIFGSLEQNLAPISSHNHLKRPFSKVETRHGC